MVKETVYKTPFKVEQEKVIAPQKIQEPNYPDTGVDYGGYGKKIVTGNQYLLVKQDENSIQVGMNQSLAGLPAGTYTINRGSPLRNFVFSHLTISYIQTGIIQQLSIDDGSGSNGIRLLLPSSTGNIMGFAIVPKVFISSTISINISAAIPANEFICFSLYGWYEDK